MHSQRWVVGVGPFELLAGAHQAVVAGQCLAGISQKGPGVAIPDKTVDLRPVGLEQQDCGIDIDAVLLGQGLVFLGVDLEADGLAREPLAHFLILPGCLVELLARPTPDGVEIDQDEPLRSILGGPLRPIQAEVAEWPLVGVGPGHGRHLRGDDYTEPTDRIRPDHGQTPVFTIDLRNPPR